MLEPGEGIKLKESQQPITLLVENSSSNGVRPVAYTFEVSNTATFELKLYARSGVTSGPDGRTRVTVDAVVQGHRRSGRGLAVGHGRSTELPVVRRP